MAITRLKSHTVQTRAVPMTALSMHDNSQSDVGWLGRVKEVVRRETDSRESSI